MLYKVGDLMKFTEDAFAHGCNCRSTMKSGVAKAVSVTYPEMVQADMSCRLAPIEKLGNFSFAPLIKIGNKWGYNIYSQFDYTGRAIGKMDLDYAALELGLRKVCNNLISRSRKTLALPRIGCGLAGGDWIIAEKILEKVSKESGIQFTIYDLK